MSPSYPVCFANPPGGLAVPTGVRFGGNVLTMKEQAVPRRYRQRRRAEAAEANTERIMQAALDLFVEKPLDQITLAEVAARAGVGLQTLIRRVGTKDGLARTVNEWTLPQVAATRGEPVSSDPRAVAAALAPPPAPGRGAAPPPLRALGREHGPDAAPGRRVARPRGGGGRGTPRPPRVG